MCGSSFSPSRFAHVYMMCIYPPFSVNYMVILLFEDFLSPWDAQTLIFLRKKCSRARFRHYTQPNLTQLSPTKPNQNPPGTHLGPP